MPPPAATPRLSLQVSPPVQAWPPLAVGALFVDTSEIASLLLVRYCGFVPLLLFTRQLIATTNGKPSDAKHDRGESRSIVSSGL